MFVFVCLVLFSFRKVSSVSLYSNDPLGIQGALDSSGENLVIELHAGLYMGTNNCNLAILSTSAAKNITIIGLDGPEKTIVDCQHQSRCLAIVDFAGNIKISGVGFRNGQMGSNATSTSTRQQERKRRRRRRMLPIRKRKRSRVLFSMQFHLSDNGKLMYKVVGSPRKKKRNDDRAAAVLAAIVDGGCILVDSFSGDQLIFDNIVVTNCISIAGGGIGVVNSNGSVILQNSVIKDNGAIGTSVTKWTGAGCSFHSSSSVTIQSSVIANNYFVQSDISSNTYLYAAGLYLNSCSNVRLLGPLVFTNNSMTTVGDNILVGGALYISHSSQCMITGPLEIRANSLQSHGSGTLFGTAMYLSLNLNGVVLTGPVVVQSNVMSSTGTSFLNCAGLYFEYNYAGSTLIGPITISNNWILSRGKGDINSGGLYWYMESGSTVYGPLFIGNNTLDAYGGGNIFGGSINIESSNDIALIGAITVSGNVLTAYGRGSLFGGGLSISNSNNITIAGSVIISNHTLNSVWELNQAFKDPVPYVQPNSTKSQPQCSAAIISNVAGSFNDGSGFGSSYAPSLHCSWLLSPSVEYQLSHVFNVTVVSFSTEQGFDFLYLYDGSSAQSPIIGQYSGNIGSNVCSNGPCPSLNEPIITQSGQLYVLFTSDDSDQFDGFTIAWSMVTVNRISGLVGSILDDFGSYPQVCAGAGIAVISSAVLCKTVHFFDNYISSSYGISMGAGLHLDSSSALSVFVNLLFENNVASGFHSAGSAVSAIKNSKFQCSGCWLNSNCAKSSITATTCIYTSEKGVICPTVFGGSVLLAGSRASWTNSSFWNSRASCSAIGIACSALGGVMAVIHQHAGANIVNSTLIASAVLANNGYSSTLNAGGMLYVDNAAVSIVASLIANNTVYGTGTGGAIYAAAASVIVIDASKIASNRAKLGGAVGMADSSFVRVSNSEFVCNEATSIAGAFFMKDDASIALNKVGFQGNIASRASSIYSFNDNLQANYEITGLSATVPLGSTSIMLGSLNFTDNIWNCSQPGTVFSNDETGEFFSMTCVACDAGTYALDAASTAYLDRKCQTCPFGARCLGSSETSNGLFALPDYWGVSNSNGTVVFFRCPSEYCCPFSSDCVYNFCQGNRVGTLCGQCKENYGMQFFAEGCSSDDRCHDNIWFAWVMIPAVVIIAVMLLTTTGKESDGMLSVLLYFYQVMPLIKSTSWDNTSPWLLIIIQSVFNFSPSGSAAGGNGGICLLKSMTTSQKLGSRMLLQGVIFVCLGVTYVVHGLLFGCVSRLKAPRISHYVATTIRFCTIAYTTLVLVPLQMIQCITVDTKWVWWLDGSIECYSDWQKGGFAAIAILIPLPFLVIWLLAKRQWEDLQRKWQQEIWKVVTMGYKNERRYWLGISLYRRFLLVLVYVTIVDSNWKSMATTTLCMLFLVFNLEMVPFRVNLTHKFETAALMTLTVLSISTAPQLAQTAFGTSEGIMNDLILEWIQFILALWPLAAYIIVATWQFRKKLKKQMELTTSSCRCHMETEEEKYTFNSDCEIHQYC